MLIWLLSGFLDRNVTHKTFFIMKTTFMEQDKVSHVYFI